MYRRWRAIRNLLIQLDMHNDENEQIINNTHTYTRMYPDSSLCCDVIVENVRIHFEASEYDGMMIFHYLHTNRT